jgi:hypothetical protein
MRSGVTHRRVPIAPVLLLAALSACRCGGAGQVLRAESEIRQGPSSWDPVVGRGYRGDRVAKVEDGSTVVRISTAEGLTGWVAAGQVVAAPLALAAVVQPAPLFEAPEPREPQTLVAVGRLAFVLEEAGELVRIEVAEQAVSQTAEVVAPSLIGWTFRSCLDRSEREVAAARRFERLRAAARWGDRRAVAELVAGADPDSQLSEAIRAYTPRAPPAEPVGVGAAPPPRVARPDGTPPGEGAAPDPSRAGPRGPAAVLEDGQLLDDELRPIPSALLRAGALVEAAGTSLYLVRVVLPDGVGGLAPPWLISTDPGEVAVARAMAAIAEAPPSERAALVASESHRLQAEHPAARLLPVLEGRPLAPVACVHVPEVAVDVRGQSQSSRPSNVHTLPDASGEPEAQPAYDWAVLAEKALPGF